MLENENNYIALHLLAEIYLSSMTTHKWQANMAYDNSLPRKNGQDKTFQ